MSGLVVIVVSTQTFLCSFLRRENNKTEENNKIAMIFMAGKEAHVGGGYGGSCSALYPPPERQRAFFQMTIVFNDFFRCWGGYKVVCGGDTTRDRI